MGGGSLNYANTLYEPGASYFRNKQWADITDWQRELAPYYEQGRRMLGVITNPSRTPSDRAVEKVAARMGVADSLRSTPVGVFMGSTASQQPGAGSAHITDDAKAAAPDTTVADPYFGGCGPVPHRLH